MRDQVGGQVYATVRTLAEHVGQFISFAKDPGYLSLHINKFSVHIGFITWIRCACSLLSGTRYAMLTSITGSHLVCRIRALTLTDKIIVLVRLVAMHVLHARVNGIILFLSIGRVPNILCLARGGALEITALIIQMLEHKDDKILRIIISNKIINIIITYKI